MPLIDVVVDPTCVLPRLGDEQASKTTRQFIRTDFGPKIPGVFARNWAEFGIPVSIPETGVQVRHDDFDVNDVNTPELWIKVQLSEEPPDDPTRKAIRNAIYEALVALIRELGTELPANFVLDVLWGPTSGCGTVNGETIEW
jgi:hypothetical protein